MFIQRYIAKVGSGSGSGEKGPDLQPWLYSSRYRYLSNLTEWLSTGT